MSDAPKPRTGQSRGGARTRARTHSRTYAMRLLYQADLTGESIGRIVTYSKGVIDNDMADECACPHIETCVPHALAATQGSWPLDYRCPYEDLPPADRNRRCARSKVCRCRRYYLERKECPPAGYPYADGNTSKDRCRCPHYARCGYRQFYDSFAVAPDAYAIEVAEGVERERAEIDELISSVSEHWSVFRMPVVDRNILRVAVWEMRHADDVPDSVAINEAVTLAKEYGGDDSSKFVNGVLGKIARLGADGEDAAAE